MKTNKNKTASLKRTTKPNDSRTDDCLRNDGGKTGKSREIARENTCMQFFMYKHFCLQLFFRERVFFYHLCSTLISFTFVMRRLICLGGGASGNFKDILKLFFITPSKAVMPLRRKELLELKENKKTFEKNPGKTILNRKFIYVLIPLVTPSPPTYG